MEPEDLQLHWHTDMIPKASDQGCRRQLMLFGVASSKTCTAHTSP